MYKSQKHTSRLATKSMARNEHHCLPAYYTCRKFGYQVPGDEAALCNTPARPPSQNSALRVAQFGDDLDAALFRYMVAAHGSLVTYHWSILKDNLSFPSSLPVVSTVVEVATL